MKAVIQRVRSASITINKGTTKSINKGLVVLIGIAPSDDTSTMRWGAEKILHLRIFANETGKFDKSVNEIKGDILIVSQFTLFGDSTKGRRPDFTEAARPVKAIPLYNDFVNFLKDSGLKVETGEFGADMLVEINNDGPVTLILDSQK